MDSTQGRSNVVGLTIRGDWSRYEGVMLPEEDDEGMDVEDLRPVILDPLDDVMDFETGVIHASASAAAPTKSTKASHPDDEAVLGANAPPSKASSVVKLSTNPHPSHQHQETIFSIGSSTDSTPSAIIRVLPAASTGGRNRSKGGIRISRKEKLEETLVPFEKIFLKDTVITYYHKFTQTEMSRRATLRKVEKQLKAKRSGKQNSLEGSWEGAAGRYEVNKTPWRSLKFSKRSSIDRRFQGVYQKKSRDVRRSRMIKKRAHEAAEVIKERNAAAARQQRMPKNIRPLYNPQQQRQQQQQQQQQHQQNNHGPSNPGERPLTKAAKRRLRKKNVEERMRNAQPQVDEQLHSSTPPSTPRTTLFVDNQQHHQQPKKTLLPTPDHRLSRPYLLKTNAHSSPSTPPTHNSINNVSNITNDSSTPQPLTPTVSTRMTEQNEQRRPRKEAQAVDSLSKPPKAKNDIPTPSTSVSTSASTSKPKLKSEVSVPTSSALRQERSIPPPRAPKKKENRKFRSIEEEVKEQIEKDKKRLGQEEYEKRKEGRVRKEVQRIQNLDEENRKYEEREREKAKKKLEELERKEKERKERGQSEEIDNMKTTIFDDCRIDLSQIETDNLFGLAVNDYRVKDKLKEMKKKASTSAASSSSSSSKPSKSSSTTSSGAASSPHLSKLTTSFAAASLSSPRATKADIVHLHPDDGERGVLSFDEDDTDSGDADEFCREYHGLDKKDKKYDLTMTTNANWQTNPLLSYISNRLDDHDG